MVLFIRKLGRAAAGWPFVDAAARAAGRILLALVRLTRRAYAWIQYITRSTTTQPKVMSSQA